MNPKSTDSEADALTTTPPRRQNIFDLGAFTVEIGSIFKLFLALLQNQWRDLKKVPIKRGIVKQRLSTTAPNR